MFLCRLFIVFLALSYVFGYKRHVKIFGGEKAPLGKFPYKASVQYRDRHECGGSIVSNRWILTAAHCIDPGIPYTVLVGIVTLNNGGVRYPTIKQIVHNFDPFRGLRDIGLLKTSTEISFSKYVSPIALGVEKVEGSVEVILSGWGMTSSKGPEDSNELLSLKLRTITNQECVKVAPTVLSRPRDEHICAFSKHGEGACFGDSGGALANKDNDKVVGIVSRTMVPGKCAVGYPDIYTRVSSHIDWIEKTMKEN